jgi:hypothetical protein
MLYASVIGILALTAIPAHALNNTGFETPDKGDATTGWQYAPTGASWVFSASAGLAGPNSPWKCNSVSPDPLGNQFAFLQYGASITQDLSGLTVSGTYDLSFFEAYRTEKLPGNDLSVILDEGLPTQIIIYNNSNVTSPTWTLRHTDSFVATKASYTLTFRSTYPLGTGDCTTLIDGVYLTLINPPPITYVRITNDADCDISVFKSYTHKLDFGQGTPGAQINGVQFNAYNNAANGTLNFNRTVTTGSATDHAGNTPTGVSGNLGNLMRDMYYNNANTAGGITTWTLSGLTAGVTYDARIYVRQYGVSDSRRATLVYDPDGAGPVSHSTGVISEDNALSVGMAAAADPYYINCRFTAVTGENLVITVTQHNANNSWHLYGTTCEQVAPTLKTLSPADNAVGVLPNVNLVATFDVNVFKGSGNIRLKRISDDSVVETFDVSSAGVIVSGAQVTLNPSSDLDRLTGYYVEIDAGAFVDHGGRSCLAVTGNTKWNFTTVTDIVSFVKITNDADCDIKASKNYTHKLDFGLGTPGALINGVQFDAYNRATNNFLNFTRAVSSGSLDDHAGSAPAGVSGALVNLLTDMYYNGNCAAGGTTTWTLRGLTPGASYIVRIYARPWGVGFRPVTLVFDPDGAGPLSDAVAQINEDNATSVGMAAATDAYYISYPFTAVAGADLVITATQHTYNGSWHLYGITNERLPSKGTYISFR